MKLEKIADEVYRSAGEAQPEAPVLSSGYGWI